MNYFRQSVTHEYLTDIFEKAKSGIADSPAPIKSILEITDRCIPTLFWLANNRRENIKKYAVDRWSWPAYVHLLKREQAKYESLLPKFNNTGTKIIQESPIQLGSKLSLQLNANLTKGDIMFRIAAYAILRLVLERERTDFWRNNSWMWLPTLHTPLQKLKGQEYTDEAVRFLKSLGKFSRDNFAKWRPVFESYLTFNYGPPEPKFQLIPPQWKDNLYVCMRAGAGMQWFENYKKSHPVTAADEVKFASDIKTASSHSRDTTILQEMDDPEIKKIVNRRKTKKGEWVELIDELLKRVYNLAYPK